jgi:G:T-mismatch repair DNA endonuclease (very short patch repair protein)
MEDELWAIFRSQTKAFKINFSYGFVLRHVETSELRYFHASQNNARLLDVPRLVRNKEDFTNVLEDIHQEDILQFVHLQRENTKWTVHIVTNLCVYVNPIKDHPIGSSIVLPDHIKNNKAIHGLVADHHTGLPYEDKLCIFRCISLSMGYTVRNFKKMVDRLVSQFPKGKNGVTLGDLPELEKQFKVKINVWKLDEDDIAELIQRSTSDYDIVCNVNLYEDHFSYIKDLEKYSKSYRCTTCDKLWKHEGMYHRHQATCVLGIKHQYSGGTYHSVPTVWEELEDVGIQVEDRFFPFRATFDIEVYFSKEDLPKNTDKVEWVAKHHLLSISVASNVPGYEEPICFVSGGDSSVVVADFITHLGKISEASYSLLRDDYNWIFEELEELESQDDEDDIKTPCRLAEKLDAWLHQLPVLSFNGGRYDLNVLKKDLMDELDIEFVVKKGQDFMCIATDSLRFLDICNYLAAGCSYDKYIKAYNCTQQKGFFPYEWMDDLHKLNYPALPPSSAFYSQLKKEGISNEDYAHLQRVWDAEGMSTVRDLLVWYNNLDVVPMLEAIEKQCAFFIAKGIDMFKDGISLPGLCQKYLFTFPDKDTVFALVDHRNEDLYHMLRESIVGGPSIVFHRHHHAGKTTIRPAEYGEEARTCGRILGLDANALYLWAIMQDMPTGFPTRHVVQGDGKIQSFPQQKFGQKACDWLDAVSAETGYPIKHMRNSREKRIAGLPVDGWCPATRTVYQFHGCYFHGCPCQGEGTNAFNDKTFTQLREETKAHTTRIQKAGYEVVEKWECEWEGPVRKTTRLTDQDAIIRGVKEGSLFGFVQCDIHVPDEHKSKFAEIPPIFKNTLVKREDIGEFMENYADINDIMSQPRRSLVGSFFGEKILLSTPLLR